MLLSPENVRVPTRVFLDGIEVDGVVSVDTLECTIEVQKKDSEGHVVIENECVVCETRKGQITLMFPAPDHDF